MQLSTTLPAPAPDNRRVIAWLDHHPRSILILHAAHRRAKQLGCGWCVAYTEISAPFPTVEGEAAQHMLRLRTLAEQMGAEMLPLRTDNIEKGLAALFKAEKNNIALLVIGGPDTSRPFAKWRAGYSAWKAAVHAAQKHTRVEIVPLSSAYTGKIRWNGINWRQFRSAHFIYAFVAVGVAYLAALGLEWILPPALFRINMQNVSLLFMTACAFTAGRYGLLPGLTAAVAGSLTYNYFYMPPYGAWRIDTVTEALNIAIFLSAGLLIALFTSQVRSYAESVVRREHGTQALFTLYRLASTAFSRQQMLETLPRRLSEMLDIEVAFFLPYAINPDRIEPAMPADLVLKDIDRKALDACWMELKTTGMASPLHTQASWRFEPMIAPGGEIGVLAARPKSGRKLDLWLSSLLTNIADQTAVLLEHIELGKSMEATRLREEREKLRSMLLSSVSHDLKTPLAGIIGALSVHRSVGDRLTATRRKELLDSALSEAQRLDSFITNILDMTRLESGRIDLHQEWHDIAQLVQQVGKRAQHRLQQRPLLIHPFPPDVEVYMDVLMTEQVLQNLLDNACKYTPDGTRIEIDCIIDEHRGFLCRVRDFGPGIPEEKLGQVFDKYARLHKRDSQVAGTGLGLAICKAVMDIQHGWITAANHAEGGAEFAFCLPQWRKTGDNRTKEEASYAAR